MIKTTIAALFKKPVFKHILFWLVIYLYYLSVTFPYEENKVFVAFAISFDVLFQIGLTYTIIDVLIPKLLNKNKKTLFFIAVIILTYGGYVAYYAYKCFFLTEAFKDVFIKMPPLIFLDRVTNISEFIRSFPSDVTPALVLLAFDYYRKQKETAILLEQKKTNELNALRNQLNPHFLFNTLNNLYTLALKKSDKTPEVIAKLSDILDYILYRCNGKFVPLKNEVNLLHNYIALEKVRYGKRVEVNFNEDLKNDVQIAPLLLLTFLENAFKHGVSQEINTATIDIDIQGDLKLINFKIENTKPNNLENNDAENRDSIGLQNIKKQLDLLYLNKYNLDIENKTNMYSVSLKIKPNEV